MDYQYFIYEKKNRLAYITINRPEVMNAMHRIAGQELTQILSDFRDDPEVWVAIITGAGDRAFSTGNDLKYTASHPEEAGRNRGQRINAGLTGGHFDCWKPIIAAVNGYALGGGFELALACDIIVAAEHARFGLPEPRVGLIAGGGGIHRLPRQIPFKMAMDLLLTARQITAQEAYRLGLVAEVVPADQLMAAAEKRAEMILECAPLSIRATKQAAMIGIGMPLELALDHNYSMVLAYRASEDIIEGPRAFAEKRKPNWKGR